MKITIPLQYRPCKASPTSKPYKGSIVVEVEGIAHLAMDEFYSLLERATEGLNERLDEMQDDYPTDRCSCGECKKEYRDEYGYGDDEDEG